MTSVNIVYCCVGQVIMTSVNIVYCCVGQVIMTSLSIVCCYVGQVIMTSLNIVYCCVGQVIVQRALAAKSLSHAQGATLMAGLMKILPIFIMVLPGMISRVLYPGECPCPEFIRSARSNPVHCFVSAFHFSSVQFGSRWYLCARKRPYALHPVSQN